MKKSRFTNEQIAFALQQAEAGTPVTEICRKMGASGLLPALNVRILCFPVQTWECSATLMLRFLCQSKPHAAKPTSPKQMD